MKREFKNCVMLKSNEEEKSGSEKACKKIGFIGSLFGDLLEISSQIDSKAEHELEHSDKEEDEFLNDDDKNDDTINLSFHQSKLIEQGFIDQYNSVVDISTITKIWYKSMLYECSICCCPIEEDNLMCTCCSQHYHDECIKNFNRVSQQCPLCRSPRSMNDFIPDVNYKSKIFEMKKHMIKISNISKCEKHCRSAGLYCVDCQKCVCDLCVINKVHKSHKITKFLKIYNTNK